MNACTGTTAQSALLTDPTLGDHYRYQPGFGNRFASEAIPGVLPHAQNAPQRVKYDLYSEQLNGSAFVSPRASIQNTWMYRIFPSVAHGPLKTSRQCDHNIESCFLSPNPDVSSSASHLSWTPFALPSPSTSTDFIHGLSTLTGTGDSSLKTGLAIHIYTANASMTTSAFSNNDGDLLILPQIGILDIQTELGRLMVRPGELVVIQAGIKFRVSLPYGPSRGYVQEVFGTHYELPELGPLGSNGMAYPRDFETPVASFDIDANTEWSITYKTNGQLHTCAQKHTPFDVVAWHGNYAPYKYALENFINLANVCRDQADPTIYNVLTAPSSTPGISLTDFLAFTPRWSTTTNTFRPPYYHRNMSAEIMGLIYGAHGDLEPGGLRFEGSYMPHGESYSTWLEATSKELKVERVGEGTLAFMFHVGRPVMVTRWALESSGCLRVGDNSGGEEFKGHFLEHLEEVNADLKEKGLPGLGGE